MKARHWTRSVLAAATIWGVGATVGAAVAGQSLAALAPAVEKADRVVETETEEVTSARLYLGILGRNLAVYFWLLCGLVSGGLTTIALLAFNGVVLGQIAGFAVGAGMPVERLALLTLPHAVPEIAAFLLAGAIGLRGPALLSAWFEGVFSRAPLIAAWRPAAGGALAIAAAAAIEVFVTVPIAKTGFGL